MIRYFETRRPFADLRQNLGKALASRSFSSWVAATVLSALVGPFGTYGSMPLMERAIYWGVLIGCAIVVARLIKAAALARLPGSEFQRDLSSSVLIALTLGPMIWAANTFVFDVPEALLPSLSKHMLVVFAISLVVLLVRLNFCDPVQNEVEESRVDEATEPEPPAAELPILFERLPESLGHDLTRVSADGHYLEVVTTKGRGRILMRFSDAMTELAGSDGLRIHRSHWVALAAIARVEQLDRRVFVVLRDGTRWPVSQANLGALTDAGFQPVQAVTAVASESKAAGR